MKINYTFTTWVLTFVLVVTYGLHWQDIFSHNNKTQEKVTQNMPLGHDMGNMEDGTTMSGSSISSSSIDKMMMDMTGRMQGKAGDELEKIFLVDMIVHHQGAVDMAKLLLTDTTIKPELRKFAEKIIAAQNPEIEQMKTWVKGYK